MAVIAPALALAAVAVFGALRARGGAPPAATVPVAPSAVVAATAAPVSVPPAPAAAAIDRPRDRGAAPVPRRAARTPPRLSKAMTLDPYR